jgi:hypothetical protein
MFAEIIVILSNLLREICANLHQAEASDTCVCVCVCVCVCCVCVCVCVCVWVGEKIFGVVLYLSIIHKYI